jgi:hypothetical protein
MCSETAALNGVTDRVYVRGAATTAELERHLRDPGPHFILCDCEGCELELLDPAMAPGLQTATILVELHDFLDRSITPTILDRFQQTHEIERIPSSDRDPREYEELKGLSDEEAALALAEFRPERMEWAWMKPAKAGTP